MKKKIFILFIIIITDLFLFELWVFYINPSPSVSIYLAFALPFLFLANIVIAGIMYTVRKEYALCFVINSFVSVLLMYLLFGWATERNLKRTMEKWTVSVNDKKYEIVRYKQDDTFYILVDFGDGALQGMGKDRGVVHLKNDTLFFLTVDGMQYFIHDGFIFNFKGTKKERARKML